MKKILSWLLALFVVAIVLGAFVYLYKKSQSKPVVFQTEQAETADITKKTVATGSIVPRREVEVKPKVTGVLALRRAGQEGEDRRPARQDRDRSRRDANQPSGLDGAQLPDRIRQREA
jgi:multidrug efflux pump subunit AcrA (membrane-fusion protein)